MSDRLKQPYATGLSDLVSSEWMAVWVAYNEQVDSIRELEAEVAQLTEKLTIQANRCVEEANRAEAAEAKLRAVGELPGKWRVGRANWESDGTISRTPRNANSCADELEARLKEGAL